MKLKLEIFYAIFNENIVKYLAFTGSIGLKSVIIAI